MTSDHIKAFYSIYVKYPHIKFGLDNALYLELCAYYEDLKNKGKLKTYNGLELDRFIFVDDEVKGNTLTLSTHPVQHDKHCIAWSVKGVDDSLLFIPDNGEKAYRYLDRDYITYPYTYYFIESNFDVTLQVLDKKRDTRLKRRVLGSWGHSSNEDAIEKAILFLERSEVNRSKPVKAIAFHHLSDECNNPELAREFHDEWLSIFGKRTLFKGVNIVYALEDEVVKL